MVPILDEFRNGGGNTDEVTDEQIMNAIRRQDQKVVKTAEVADELPITQDWTSNRLNKLESKGRIHSKSVGQGRVWWPDDAEPDSHVAESIGDLMWYTSQAEQTSIFLWLTSAGMFILGGVLMIPILLLGVLPGVAVIPITMENFATVAMASALVASLLLIVGGVLKLISLGIQRKYTLKGSNGAKEQ